jgi:LmbE family N-acetylglucosaminyl deacetylase
MADRPRVVICCPSTGDYGSTEIRFAESTEAVRILGGCGTEQWDGQDLEARMRAYDMRWRPMVVWAPHPQASHPDHRTVAAAALRAFGARVRQFHTYDGDGKVRAGVEATFAPDGLLRKIQARACYRSQISHPRASMFFQWDLTEYQECAP